MTKEEKEKAKLKKMKEIIKEKLKKWADFSGKAVDLEQQQKKKKKTSRYKLPH